MRLPPARASADLRHCCSNADSLCATASKYPLPRAGHLTAEHGVVGIFAVACLGLSVAEMKAMALLRKKYRPARRQTGQDAWIGIHGSFATRQCFVIDLSESGAKIRVDDPSFVRPEFHLKFSRVDPGRRCRIAWRKGSLIGIAFA